jgi:hypothetical protein
MTPLPLEPSDEFVRSLEEVSRFIQATPNQPIPEIGIKDGRVYQKEFSKSKTLDKFIDVHPEKAHRHVDFLEKLLTAKQSGRLTPNAKLIADQAIQRTLSKILRPEELNVVQTNESEAFTHSIANIQDPHMQATLLAQFRQTHMKEGEKLNEEAKEFISNIILNLTDSLLTTEQLNQLDPIEVLTILKADDQNVLGLDKEKTWASDLMILLKLDVLNLNAITNETTKAIIANERLSRNDKIADSIRSIQNPETQMVTLIQLKQFQQLLTQPAEMTESFGYVFASVSEEMKNQISHLITNLEVRLLSPEGMNTLEPHLQTILLDGMFATNEDWAQKLRPLSNLGKVDLNELTSPEAKAAIQSRFQQEFNSMVESLTTPTHDRGRKCAELVRVLYESHPSNHETVQTLLGSLFTKPDLRGELLNELLGGETRPKQGYEKLFWWAIPQHNDPSSSAYGTRRISGKLYISNAALPLRRPSPDPGVEWNRAFWHSLQDLLTKGNTTQIVFENTVIPYPQPLLSLAAKLSLATDPVPAPQQLLNFMFVKINPKNKPLLSIGNEGPVIPQLLLNLKPKDISEEIYHAALAYQAMGTEPEEEDVKGVSDYLFSHDKNPAFFLGGDLYINPTNGITNRNSLESLRATFKDIDDAFKLGYYSQVILPTIPKAGEEREYMTVSVKTWETIRQALERGAITYEDLLTPVEISFKGTDTKMPMNLAMLKIMMPAFGEIYGEGRWDHLTLPAEDEDILKDLGILMFSNIQPPDDAVAPILAFLHEQRFTNSPEQIQLEHRLLDMLKAEEEGVEHEKGLFEFFLSIAQTDDLKGYLETHLNR